MATTKRSPADRVRALLTKNKALTENEVLDRIKGTSRKEIRALRVALGIDRQSAIADARGRLAKEPGMPAGRLISDILAAHGVRLGPPDVSRLRPVKKKTGRRPKSEGITDMGRMAGFLAATNDSVRGKRGKRAKEVREAIQLIASDLALPPKPIDTLAITLETIRIQHDFRLKRLEARVKKLEGGKR